MLRTHQPNNADCSWQLALGLVRGRRQLVPPITVLAHTHELQKTIHEDTAIKSSVILDNTLTRKFNVVSRDFSDKPDSFVCHEANIPGLLTWHLSACLSNKEI